jgi:uncharacterized lipoprotein YmbA
MILTCGALTPPTPIFMPVPFPHPQQRITRRLGLQGLGLLGLSHLCGCRSWLPGPDPTRFYLLTTAAPPPTGTAAPARWRVALRPVFVPSYLRTLSMVIRTDAHELRFSELHRWAEPLEQGIGRVLGQTLSATGTVTWVPLTAAPDWIVTARVEACEGRKEHGKAGTVQFALTWEAIALPALAALPRRDQWVAPPTAWDGADYGQLAELLSLAVTQAGQAMAAGFPAPQAGPP